MLIDEFTFLQAFPCLAAFRANDSHFTTSTVPESPSLPEHLDRFIEQDWNPESSAAIDKWLQYTELEFGCDGGENHE
ncbi:MAG: hypothetical protein HC769_21720 [Cyanobacteria bacterium CRU_2_1]|nr:hypothetical protein [Cyanobacteria bacterium CRU_2_1]